MCSHPDTYPIGVQEDGAGGRLPLRNCRCCGTTISRGADEHYAQQYPDDDRQLRELEAQVAQARLWTYERQNQVLARAFWPGDTAPMCLECGGNAETCRHSPARFIR